LDAATVPAVPAGPRAVAAYLVILGIGALLGGIA
jgi:hypothetical protein